VGDSLVKRAGVYAATAKQDQLGQTRYNIVWSGSSGMRWCNLLHTLQFLMLSHGHPKAIILHLGGNDIHSIVQKELMQAMHDDLDYIFSVFTESVFVWCDILPRLAWRNNNHSSPKTLNIKRKRINRAARKIFMSCRSGLIISPPIQWHMPELFLEDGVHLSEFGNLIYLQTLRNLLASLVCNN